MARLNIRETVKITRRYDGVTKSGQNAGTPYCFLTAPFETTERENIKDPQSKNKTEWVTIKVNADKATGQLPRVMDYIQVGKVVEVSGVLSIGLENDRDGNPKATATILFPHFSFVPRETTVEEAPVEAEVGHGEPEAAEPDPFADEA